MEFGFNRTSRERACCVQAERARKNAENELSDASTRINELTVSVTSLSGDKRRMEADFQSMHADLNEALNARRASDERADRLQMELNRLTEELRQVDTHRHAFNGRFFQDNLGKPAPERSIQSGF